MTEVFPSGEQDVSAIAIIDGGIGFDELRVVLGRSSARDYEASRGNYGKDHFIDQNRDLARIGDFYRFYAGEGQPNRLQEVVNQESLTRFRQEINLDLVEDNLRGANRVAVMHQRLFVWVRDLGACVYCADEINPFPVPIGRMQPDHVIPYDGANTLVENLVCSCEKCNVAKGSNNAVTFKNMVRSPGGITSRDKLYKSQKLYFTQKEFMNKYGREPSEAELRGLGLI